MRGTDCQSGKLFSYICPEAMVPTNHTLPVTRLLVKAALGRLTAEFEKFYAPIDRTGEAAARVVAAGFLLGALGSGN
jgi:hypothetical protein